MAEGFSTKCYANGKNLHVRLQRRQFPFHERWTQRHYTGDGAGSAGNSVETARKRGVETNSFYMPRYGGTCRECSTDIASWRLRLTCKALLNAQKDPRLLSIFKATRSIAFNGTPPRGSPPISSTLFERLLEKTQVPVSADVLQLLLEKGADVNAQGRFYGNALYAASALGHAAVVQLLLENRAEVNVQGGFYGNALYTASTKGHEAIVKLLLENGAEVNVQGGFYGNALYAASARAYEAIVKLLLENGAEVNVQGGFYSNALYAASAKGHEAIVKLLLRATRPS
jgi:hypothetical protein